MLGKIRIVFIVLILVGGGGLLASFLVSQEGFTPHPYRFESFEPAGKDEAAVSDILILGDRMGERLSYYTPSWEEKRGWKVYNWSESGEGLHRVLNKLRHLSRLPPVVIYHGGVDEFYEKKFHPGKDYQKIRQNLIIHQKNKKTLWAKQFPRLTAFFLYPSSGTTALPENPRLNIDDYKAFEKQRQMELVYHFYKLEFQELSFLFKGKESVLIVIPPPLNLDRVPGRVCDNAATRIGTVRQKQLKELLDRGELARAATLSDGLVRDFPGNALSFYLRGQSYKRMGQLRKAKASLYRAGLYDCDTSRGSIIFNKIMLTLAEKQNLTIVDFNSIVNNNFGEEKLFIEDLYPKKAYYQQLIGVVEKEVERILKEK